MEARCFCLENGYSIEFRFKSLKEVLNPNDDVFYFQDANVYFVVSKTKNGIPGLFLREIKGKSPDMSSRVVLFAGAELLHSDPDIIYKDWSVLKISVSPTRFKIYFNDSLIRDIARTTAPLVNSGAFTFAFLDYQAAIDWVKCTPLQGTLLYTKFRQLKYQIRYQPIVSLSAAGY